MAAKIWIKSLQCKSSSLDDVYTPSFKKTVLPLSCTTNAVQDTRTNKKHHHRTKSAKSTKPRKLPPNNFPSPSPAPSTASSSFPTLTELPEGHSSRRVVEIIFGSSWSSSPVFPGRIEMLFRVHNPSRTVARFEEYRNTVRSSVSDDSRCAADGNEMMRFHCPPSGDGIYDATVVSSVVSGKIVGIRTFAGSGAAHESVGSAPGRRSMLVCRVVAGRVGGESVSGSGKDELIVFDERAVLPCFLIIYKV